MFRLKKKNKIYRSFEDFYKKQDLKVSEIPKTVNLTIEDYNACGEIINPRAPCVVTTIDPEYTKHATLRRITKKYRMKTDMLTLREITRKKFMIYATQQRYLEKIREATFQEKIYIKVKQYQKFIDDALHKSKSNAFNEMRNTQEQLENLEKNKISDELKKEISEHQRVLMEVQEVYGRFLFLLKIIGYFDNIIALDDIDDNNKKMYGYNLPQPKNTLQVQISEQCPVSKKEILNVIDYMNTVVRHYLLKRNHLNANIWIKGYERTREKIFTYSRRFTNVVLLNHLVAIVNEKSEKTLNYYTKKPMFLTEPSCLKERIRFLKHRKKEVLEEFGKKQKKDELRNKLFAVLTVILDRIELKILQNDATRKITTNIIERKLISSKKSCKIVPSKPSLDSKSLRKNEGSIIEKVEELQLYLMGLIQDLEKNSSDECKKLENKVRKRIQTQKELSQHALTKQNRLLNWIDHFKRHDIQRRNN